MSDRFCEKPILSFPCECPSHRWESDESGSATEQVAKTEIHADAWAKLKSDVPRPFEKPKSGRIAVKVINHLGDAVMKAFRVD